MATIEKSPSWWEHAQRDGFAAACCARFETNFEKEPTFIVRSEYIKTKGSKSHQLRKTAQPYESMASGRSGSSGKHVASRMSQQAMQSTSLLGGAN